jgi:hypothetical protein
LATARASLAESPAGVDSFPVLHPAKSRAAAIRVIPHGQLKMARFIATPFLGKITGGGRQQTTNVKAEILATIRWQD